MRMISIHLTTMMLVLAAAGAAHADDGQTMWSMNGAGCVPGDPAIQGNQYMVVAGSVGLRPAATGPVTLYCPIAKMGRVDRNWGFLELCPDHQYILRMTYWDGDGDGQDVDVRAELLGLSKKNGILGSTGAVIHSSDSPDTAQTNLDLAFTNVISTQSYYYYVRVDLSRRERATANAVFYGVALECAK